MKRFLFLIALGVAGAYMFRTFCYEGIYVASESMEPTFPKDRHVMVNKLSVFFKKPVRGDVVIEAPRGAFTGLDGKDLAGRTNPMCGEKAEVTVMGPHVHEGHSGLESPMEKCRQVGFIDTMNEDM